MAASATLVRIVVLVPPPLQLVDNFRSVGCKMAEMTHDELDLVVMGQVVAGCFSAETLRQQERTRSFTIFHHNGVRICQKTLLFLHAMGYNTSFVANGASGNEGFVANGVVTRVQGNKGRAAGRTSSL